jgi:RNA polymerase sigma-70 factor (ECF subfamily)
MSRDNNIIDYLRLVKQAQLGDEKSMARLTELVEPNLSAYIYRLTMDYNLVPDLLQETQLEMVKSLKRLKFESASRFWAWLYRTALGKVQLEFRHRKRRKEIQMSTLDKEDLSRDKEDLSRFTSPHYDNRLNHMIRNELSDSVFEAMSKLKFRHRTILTLRCFQQMPYSEIASTMGGSELQARALFFRAKHSLKRQLSKSGFGKKWLLMALASFARRTMPAEASSATVTVTAASTKVGPVATLIGAAGTKLGIAAATVITTTALTLGGITAITNSKPIHETTTVVDSNLVTRNTFTAQAKELVSTMQMAADTAANGDKRYEVIIDLREQSYTLRDITSADLAHVREEEIILKKEFGDNCRIVYVLFDDFAWTDIGRAKFRAADIGWQFGGKVILLDVEQDGQEYSVLVERNGTVSLKKGDVELLDKAKNAKPAFFWREEL